MTTAFEVVTEEFVEDLGAIRALVATFSDPVQPAKARIAAGNSATLLLAATFEEFVREMAREYARSVVARTVSFERLPPKMAATAWKRTMDGLAKVQIDNRRSTSGTIENAIGSARARFTVIYEFCRGDLSQDVYNDLIHNENNMRVREMNSLFKVSGLGDVCFLLADKKSVMELFGETDQKKAHGRILTDLDDFFDRRNEIAHSLNRRRSSGPEQINNDLNLLEAIGNALCETLRLVVAGTAPAEVLEA